MQADQRAVVSGEQPFTRAGGGRRAAPRLLGDIVLAYETIAREARDEGKPFVNHLAHLAVHGFLHLLGYDHERDAEADAMEELERDILARLAIPIPIARLAIARADAMSDSHV